MPTGSSFPLETFRATGSRQAAPWPVSDSASAHWRSSGCRPLRILERASNEINEKDRHIATALVGIVDVRGNTVTLASAGHFPPLLVSAAASHYLDLPPGPPLGLRRSSYTNETFDFDGGDTLIAFTDGLIEERSVAIDTGMHHLASVASVHRADAQAVVAGILAEFPGAKHDDDVALLVIRRIDHPLDAE